MLRRNIDFPDAWEKDTIGQCRDVVRRNTNLDDRNAGFPEMRDRPLTLQKGVAKGRLPQV
jgi:hypothetical protein